MVFEKYLYAYYDFGGVMKTKNIIYIGLFSAIAFVLMATFSVPILLNAPYLRFEPSEVISILAAALFGPLAGVSVCFLKDLLYLFFRAKSIFGPVADFFASAVFTLIFGIIYFKNKKSLVKSGIIATIARLIFIIPLNVFILKLQFGYTTEIVFNMLLPIIFPFNLIKTIINFVCFYYLFLILTKRIPKLTINNNILIS